MKARLRMIFAAMLLALMGLVVTAGSAQASTTYYLPYPSGRTYVVTQGPGGATSHQSVNSAQAIDFGLSANDDIAASASGTLYARQYHSQLGNMVMIQHSDGYCTLYAHMSGFSAAVNSMTVGSSSVGQGQVIGYAGSTGSATTGVHLHFGRAVCSTWQTMDVDFAEVANPQDGHSYTSQNGGAPPGPADTDGDSVVDTADICPTVTGDPVHDSGCLFERETVLTLEADINADSYDDVVAVSRGYYDDVALYWLENNQNGTFASPQSLATLNVAYWKASELKFFTADYNGDGKTDLVAANGSLSASSIYIYGFASTGSGLGAPVNLATLPRSAWEIEMTRFLGADINGDGRDDVVAVNRGHYDDVALYWFKSNTSGTLDAPASLATLSPTAWKASELKFFVGDYNADGKTDVLAANGTPTSVSMYIYGFASNGSTLNGPINLLTLPGSAWKLSTTQFLTGDLDNDARADVIALSTGPNDEIAPYWFRSYVNSGSDVLDTPAPLITLSSSAWKSSELKFFSGDYDNDGKVDLLAANWSASSPSMYVYGFASTGSGLSNPITMLTQSGSAWPLLRTQY